MQTLSVSNIKMVKNPLLPFAILLYPFLASIGFTQQPPEGIEFFEKKIRPVLIRECYSCHSTQTGQSRGGLMLDTQHHMQLGGDSGPAIVAGDLEESILWSAINYQDYRMPPSKPLPQSVIKDFRTWIEMGAPDPRVTKTQKINSEITPEDIEQGREFWAFVRPQTQAAPEVTQKNWPHNDIDQFILRKLEEHALGPAADTDANSLLRRLSFDLIGLPPTMAQIEQFQQAWKKNPQAAIEETVDSLLQNPAFGERWGRHWLDVARYAESSGRELNATFPNAWRYRDYVIDSFNKDKPYDRFIQEQIAGDLLPIKNDQEWATQLIATGFLAIGPKGLTEQNGRQFQLDLVDEQIDATTRVILGLSVACARCHDHKFDPIPQSDYYAIAGIFQNTKTHYGTVDTFQNRRPSDHIVLPVKDANPIYAKLSATELANLKQQIEEKREESNRLRRERRQMRRSSEPNNADQNTIRRLIRVGSELANLEAKLNLYDSQGRPETLCMAVQASTGLPQNARLLIRGEFDQPADEVPRGFVQVVSRTRPEIAPRSTGRLELAQWLTARDNPLTARVMVNRIWKHLMGQGIVRTPENFGATGMAPTHPELLDHLAVEFMENGWSVKNIVRQIATSRIYRAESQYDSTAFGADPENKFFWRVEPRRLDAEVLRDSLLSLGGNLQLDRPRASLVAYAGSGIVRDTRIFSATNNSSTSNMSRPTTGESMRNEFQRRMQNRTRDGRNTTRQSDARSRRPGSGSIGLTVIEQPSNHRSIYLPILRDSLPRALDVFDFAEPSLIVGKRESSNTPDQGLYFLNNPFVIQQSRNLATRLQNRFPDPRQQIENAFLLAYGREPTKREMQATENFYREYKTSGRSSSQNKLDRLAAICQAIVAGAEFRFIR